MPKSSTQSTPTASTVSSGAGQPAHSRVTTFGNRAVRVVRAVMIRRPASELYAFFKSSENLSKNLSQSLSISREDALTSRWSISLPGNQRAESRIQIINDHPGELLAWSSLDESGISFAATVRFEKAPGNEGTEVIVNIEYDPPRGNLAATFERISGQEAGQQLGTALHRLKDAIESGRVPTSVSDQVGNPS